MRNKLLTRDRKKFQRKLFSELEPQTAIAIGIGGAKSERVFVVRANSCIRDEDTHCLRQAGWSRTSHGQPQFTRTCWRLQKTS